MSRLGKKFFSNEQYEFFDGFIASDGCIYKPPTAKNYYIAGSFKHKEFAQYILNSLDISNNIYTRKIIDDRLLKGFTYTNAFNSNRYELFTKERLRWYPEGRKIIPKDVRISPISLNIWYLGDGTRTSYGSCRKAIELCTQSFDKNNIEDTIGEHLNTLGIQCWVNNANKLYIPTKCAAIFLEYIGECPVECYKHKWDIGQLSKKFMPLEYDQLYNLYINKGLSSRKVGEVLGCSKKKVTDYLRKYNINIRNR